MSAARNMIRALRDSGALATRPPASERRRLVTTALVGVAFGAIAYLAAIFVIPQLPGLAHVLQKAPPPAHFMKPTD